MNTTEDTGAAKNILVFYGLGGIGKTTLSERLQAWANGRLDADDMWGDKPATIVNSTCRIDLHRSQGRVDMVDTVVAIRRMFGKLNKRWPAFDLAFAAYWTASHPNTPLPGAGTDDTEFADDVSASLSEVLSGLGVPAAGFATKAIRKLVKEVQAHRELKSVFSSYAGFEDLLRRCSEVPTPDDPHVELLGEVVSLLNTDLCNWDGPAPLTVVFIDTFERLLNDPRRTDEATLNQIVWRMSNVLFVITGRKAVDWDNGSRTNLFKAGESVWPGLVLGTAEEPRQHRVGDLAFADRLRIIDGGRRSRGLILSDEVAHQLAEASGGLPQYLDLALSLAETRQSNGGSPITVRDVTGSLRDLVLRVLEDVPEDEQRALRAASLFPFFSYELVAAAASADPDEGAAQRAMARPMINNRGTGFLQYSMHDAVRSAIRNSPHDIPNGWSTGDWREAAERALEAVHRIHSASKVDRDIPLSLDSLGLAIGLVCDQDVRVGPSGGKNYPDWLSQAIVFAPSINGLRDRLPTQAVTEVGEGIIDFVMAKTAELTVDESVYRLTRIFRSDHPLRLPAGRHRGYVLRNASRFEAAMNAFAELVEVSPTDLHRSQQTKTLATSRRFRDALEQAESLSADRKGQIQRACDVPHGRFDGYFEPVIAKTESLHAKHRQREALEDEGVVARWQAFLYGTVDPAQLDRLEDAADEASHSTAIRDVFLTRLLLNPAEATPDHQGLARFANMDKARNFGVMGFRTATARIALALYASDAEGLKSVAESIASRPTRRGRLWIPIECLLDSHGYPVATMQTQWLEPYEQVRDRWRSHWDSWLARTTAH
jgi:hypothetical protein